MSVPLPDLKLSTSSGVGGGDMVSQTTGPKYFGTSLAANNSVIESKQKTKNILIIASALILAFIVYKKVK